MADGYHRVPNVNRNSDGFKFDLGNFENPWNDNYILVLLCHLSISCPGQSFVCSGGVSFFSRRLLPAAEHPANVLEMGD